MQARTRISMSTTVAMRNDNEGSDSHSNDNNAADEVKEDTIGGFDECWA